ncbi:hypothetical protein RvY_13975-1 [Ramazzottius varieornatus]|uniref:Uncharacterized protein n=1 Tax=Ramazzottius varieornatus TaxID=947166 RepID=A0A1D1VUW3_RAMVA|nr:hypothetical protein RvY_13975-1 [Ramazzottius varieornatus]
MSSQRWGKARSWKSRHLYSFFLSFLSLIVSGIALTSQSWLESREGNPRFRKAGLWIFCFKDIYDANFRYPTRINGCRHIFDEDLWFLRSVYLPEFLQMVQATYTIGFMLCFSAFLTFFLYRIRYVVRLKWLILTAILHAASAFWMTVAVLIFAVRGDGRDWMPDWRRNYLSWGFSAAVMAAVGQHVTALLVMVDLHKRRKNLPYLAKGPIVRTAVSKTNGYLQSSFPSHTKVTPRKRVRFANAIATQDKRSSLSPSTIIPLHQTANLLRQNSVVHNDQTQV